MKFNALLVPVVAFATVAHALPSGDGSVQARPSDQGKYKPLPKQPEQASSPIANLGEQAMGKLPVQPLVQPPFEKLPSSPIDVKALPVDVDDIPQGVPAAMAKLPASGVLPNGVPPQGVPAAMAKLPTNGVLPNGVPPQGVPPQGLPPPANGLASSLSQAESVLPKLPVAIPPQLPHGMRRARRHVMRAATTDISCGHLRVEASDNGYSGFVSRDRDENGRYTVVKEAQEGTEVDMKGHNLVFREEDVYPVLGGTYGVMKDGNAGEDDIRGNSANFAMLTGTAVTLYGKAASSGRSSFNEATGAHQPTESAIFLFGENREIHASWINRDGSSVPAVFGVNPDGQVILSANPGQYAATYGGYSAKVFCQ